MEVRWRSSRDFEVPQGHPADHVRLGVAEERLDALTGRPGVISEIAASAVLGGKVKGTAQRAMTPALAIRFILLMTLMPADADYAGVMTALLGDLAGVPWQRPYQLPTATVASTWRDALGPVRWSSCGTCCWAASTPSTAITITGPSP